MAAQSVDAAGDNLIQTNRIEEEENSEDEILSLLSVQQPEKGFLFSEIGVKLNKRIPLIQPHEGMLQESMRKRLERIERKIKKYELTRDGVKLRKY